VIWRIGALTSGWLDCEIPAVPDESQPVPSAQPTHQLREIAGYFLRLGFTAFGGPAAHIAMMEQELVNRRQWLDRRHFLDLLAAISFIPGPNSTEMAIALGRIRGGMRGLWVAGFCFILPAVLIILPIAWIYVAYHQTPSVSGAMRGISAAVVAIVAAAVWRFGKTSITDIGGLLIALAAMLAEIILQHTGFAFGDVLILLAAGFARAFIHRRPVVVPGFAPMLAVIGGLVSVSGPLLMVLLFLKIGLTLFGSGYVLVTYLQDSFVNGQHWLTQQQMMDAIAVGQVTPGPLLTTATFAGFVVGHDQFHLGLTGSILCALAATAAIFAPAFVLIALLGSTMDRLRQNPHARGFLDGMNAAVVGLIAVACIWIARAALNSPHPFASAAIITISLIILFQTKLNPTWLIAAAGICGWVILR
jgi:chromate transporter